MNMDNVARMQAGRSISRPAENPTLRVLSLGAGVQSTTLALMSARGDLPTVDFAVFADTKAEPRKVYEHLAWLETQVPFPIIRASRDGLSLGDAALAIASGAVARGGAPMIPWFTDDPTGMLPRQCSKEYKTRVVQRVIRGKLGLAAGERAPKGITVEQWIGISWDEMQRMKTSELAFIHNRWPLMESGMDRRSCYAWLDDRQYPRPPKSSCIYCPFRDNAAWADMKENEPEDFAGAIAIDRGIRPGFPGMEGAAYVHKSRTPLETADFSSKSDGANLFDEECEGICGI
jgi:hypothetical protein